MGPPSGNAWMRTRLITEKPLTYVKVNPVGSLSDPVTTDAQAEIGDCLDLSKNL